MAKMHSLKCWPESFDAIRRGAKTFDVRRDDRNYEPGDAVKLCEFRSMVGEFSGRELTRTITVVIRPGNRKTMAEGDGLKDGYCVLGYAS